MIQITRINHVPHMINSDLIDHVEFTPDTVVSLTSGQKFVVLESPDEVVARVIDFPASDQPGTRAISLRHFEVLTLWPETKAQVAAWTWRQSVVLS